MRLGERGISPLATAIIKEVLKMENRILENNPLQPETVTNEIPAKPQDDTAARKSKANLLCYISLSLFIATILLFTGTCLFFILFDYDIGHFGMQITSILGSFSYEASWVLVIVARAKYRENKFAKKLLIIYIAITVTAAVILIAYIAYCLYTCATCYMPG